MEHTAPVDPYELLGLDEDATDKEIKKAYRKLAAKLHPDKGGDPAEFLKLKQAYDILQDPELAKWVRLGVKIPSDIEASALDIICQGFQAHIAKAIPHLKSPMLFGGTDCPVFERIREDLAAQKCKSNTELDKARFAIKKWKEAGENLRKNGEEVDSSPFHGIVEDAIFDLQRTEAENELQIKIINLALPMTEDWNLLLRKDTAGHFSGFDTNRHGRASQQAGRFLNPGGGGVHGL